MKNIFKKIKYLLPAATIMLAGCCLFCNHNTPLLPEDIEHASIESARVLLRNGDAACVLIPGNGTKAITDNGRGVSPLLNIYDRHKAEMADGIIVDKVIGRAAAAIAICGKVRRVYGEVMSEDAKEFLLKHNIRADAALFVPVILNRKRDGLCPMEQTVKGIDNPEQALAALRKKIESFKKK